MNQGNTMKQEYDFSKAVRGKFFREGAELQLPVCSDLVSERIGEWQNRLLQLGRRNQLLYFRPARTAVGIIGTTPDELRTRLEKSRSGLRFPYVQPRGRQSADPGKEAPDDVVIKGDLATDCEAKDLQRRLFNLHKRDREWEEEQGLNVLFLAAGLLTYIDAEGDEAHAPLVLFPCDLTRASLREPFVLHFEDSDVVVNPTLAYQLRQSGVGLPEFDEEEKLADYFNHVSALVRDRKGWTVEATIFLGVFAYAKLPMYEDLAQIRARGPRRELTQRLAGSPSEIADGAFAASPRAVPSGTELRGGCLDDLLDVRDQFAVLPADFSQLRAVHVARAGGHLVIHGPPGTGKSQTIANLIATLLADGKRVLFVSEKAAALDVVKRRLEQCGLGVFCLDLHSNRGRKSAVYDQIRRSVEDTQEQNGPTISFDELIERRDQLNRIVRLLHAEQPLLGRTIFEIQGEFAQLQTLPWVNFPFANIADLSAGRLARINEITGRIERRPAEFRDHRTSRWLPLRVEYRSLQLADEIRADMDALADAITELRKGTDAEREWLGLPKIINASDVAETAVLLNQLAETPSDGIPDRWLDRGIPQRLWRIAIEQQQSQAQRIPLANWLAQRISADGPPLNYCVCAKALLTSATHDDLRQVLGEKWNSVVADCPATAVARIERIEAAATDLIKHTIPIGKALGILTPSTTAEIEDALRLARRIVFLKPVPAGWLSVASLRTARHHLQDAIEKAGALTQAEEHLANVFSEGFTDMVDAEMLIRFRTEHRSWFRRLFFRNYRADMRVLYGHQRTPSKLSLDEAQSWVEYALDVRQQRKVWHEVEQQIGTVLGHRFYGRGTDWEAVDANLNETEALIEDWRGDFEIMEVLLTNESAQRELRRVTDRLASAFDEWRQASKRGDDSDTDLHLELMLVAARQALPPLRTCSAGTAAIYQRLHNRPSNIDELAELVNRGIELTNALGEHERIAANLRTDFGPFYDGADTNWDSVLHAIEWTKKFTSISMRISERLREHAGHPRDRAEYASRANRMCQAYRVFGETLAMLDLRFAVAAMPWDSWANAPLDELERWAADLRGHVGSAQAWAEYQDAATALNDELGTGVLDRIRDATECAELVGGIVRRQLFVLWLNWKQNAEPELRTFTATEHEEVRMQFRKLDALLPEVARQRVRTQCFKHYPSLNAAIGGGQLGVLRRELTKQRRQLPPRRLFERIPNLLLSLKPCFLMSPLAVSQYLAADGLESETIKFDTVIFDEASQVLPEDAIPAIERAEQVIVVGDRHQLPPTTFFRVSLDDDSEIDDEDDQFEGQESFLDVMISMIGRGVAEEYLAVHYRSRCEGLIRYSNHYFYKDRLLTFPGPRGDGEAQCVRDVLVSDGIYDAGQTRTNRREAERVVELVFELMRRQPDSESVGVVTLSRAQADLIEQLIDQHRLVERELDERFSEELDERFFVKNLENVQGDERDHMILSICYGRTADGRVPNRFGPINQKGGARRLNVVVTRARLSMTLVHSLQASDITASSAGARLLRSYLEYARNPLMPLSANVDSINEPENPLVAAVLGALRQRGHQVESQIGVSGYRIDLAICSENGERYDLGIECDGATYHSSPTARDRDWLRQQVLEGLGWCIHRVWSTAWTKSPETELAAIEQALKQAREAYVADGSPAPPLRTPDTDEVESTDVSIDSVSEANDQLSSGGGKPAPYEWLFDDYVRAELQRPDVPFLEARQQELALLANEVVQTEHPVHEERVIEYLRIAHGLGRAGRLVRNRVHKILAQLVQDGAVVRDGVFLSPSNNSPVHPRRSDRPIDRISPAELDAGLLRVVEATHGASRDELILETARQFGYQSTRTQIRGAIGSRIDVLVAEGLLHGNAEMLTAR